ncbi:MAG: hypothetical protein K9J79_01415 [Desulfobacteraceae bacterium]|nr:hypothetical protein [Desulfobacteraceae bacterium]
MQTYKDPLFRKKEAPWYRSVPVYMLFSLIFGAVTSMGIIGIDVAAGHEQYRGYVWVPAVLVFFAAFLLGLALIRVIKRKRGDSS